MIDCLKTVCLPLALLLAGASISSASDIVWQVYHEAGLTAFEAREYPKSKQLFTAALKHLEKKQGDHEVDHVIESTLGLATVFAHEGDYQHAENVLIEALDVALKELPPESLLTVSVASDLARVMYLDGRYNEAEEYAEQTLLLPGVADDASWQSAALNDLAAVKVKTNKLLEANVLARKAVEIAEGSVFDERRVHNVANALDTLAEVLHAEGKHEEALAVAEKSHKMAKENLHDRHLVLAEIQHTLADIHHTLGNHDIAASHRQGAAEIHMAHYHDAHHLLKDTLAAVKESKSKAEKPQKQTVSGGSGAKSAATTEVN